MPSMFLDTRKFLSLLFIPAFLILIAIFLILNIGTSFNPPILLLVFNTLFLGLIPLYAVYIAYKSFRASGSNGVLLKGAGMLMVGLGAITAGIVNYLPNSMNANVTVQNTGFCIGAFLQLIGILIALSGTVQKQRQNDASKILILYCGCVLAFLVFAIAAVVGAVPPFFIQGIGFTALREFIITSAIEFFVLAAGVLLWLYYKKQEEFFIWYSIGLALIGIGLLAVHFPSVLGSPLGWIGRSAQYLGGFYLLIAFIALNRSAHRTGIPMSDMLSRFFGEAETNYKTLIDTATDAIVVFDVYDRIIVWNRAAENLFGYTSEEARGSSFFQMVIPNEFTDIVKNNFRNPILPEADSTLQKPVEIVALHKDGSSFPVELALSRHVVAGVSMSTCIIHDLTSHKRDEEALRESEALLRTILDTIPSGVTVRDVQTGKLILSNTRSREIMGELVKRTDQFWGYCGTYTDGTSYRVEDWPISRSMATGVEVNDEEILCKRTDGMPITLSISSTPLRDQYGKIIMGVGVFHDITARKKAEVALREREQQFRSVMDNSKDLIYRQNLQNGRYEYISPSAETLTGFSADEFLAMDAEMARSMIHPDDISAMRSALVCLESTGKAEVEYRWHAKNGDYHWFSNHMSLIRDASGRPLYRDGSIRDINERKLAEDDLKEALSEKEALLSEIHHRVKNNLTAFISLLSLDGSYEETEGGKALRTDLQNRARSMALIHETLYRTGKFSKVDMGIYLKNLVDQIAKSYGVGEEVQIVVDVHDVTLSVDRATTAGLIINELVTNSFKYAFPPGFDCIAIRQEPCTIRVSLSHEDGQDVLRVADNGCGLPRGFDPLTSKSLGLKLVNFLARHQLRADIEVRSDKGTEFIFSLKNTEDNT